ncbi:hypothetical protein BH10ACT10_BH10ACT10_02240 [soil metagenome]
MALVVVHDRGVASPIELLAALADREFVVVLGPSSYAAGVEPLFEHAKRPVVAWEGAAETAARLRAHRPTGIVTFSEPMLRKTAILAEELGLQHHSPETARALTDKGLQRSLLRGAGVDTPQVRVVTELDACRAACEEIGLPVVVKPVRGEGSRNTMLVDRDFDWTVMAQILETERELIVEELLRGAEVEEPFGDYVSVETAVSGGHQQHYAVTGKFQLAPPFRESGQYWPAPLSESQRSDVVDLADRAVRALGIRTGLVHTEIKLTPSGPRVIEVNGRLGGLQRELGLRGAGVDLIAAAADLAEGHAVSIDVQPDQVYFQHYTPGPVAATRLVGLEGADAVRALPFVTQCRRLVRDGADLDRSQIIRLDLVCGVVAELTHLPAAITSIRDGLTYTFDGADGRVSRTATDLIRRP